MLKLNIRDVLGEYLARQGQTLHHGIGLYRHPMLNMPEVIYNGLKVGQACEDPKTQCPRE